DRDVPAARFATFSRRRELLVTGGLPTAGERHVGPGKSVPARPQDRVHELERLYPLVACQAGGHLAPEHLLQDVELSLNLANVEAGREAVRSQLVRRRDDRLDIAIVHALDDELEQIPQVPATHLRAGGLVARTASIE